MNAALTPEAVERLLRWLWSERVRWRLAGLLLVLFAGALTGALQDATPPNIELFTAPNFLTVSLVATVSGALVASPVSLLSTPFAYILGYLTTIIMLDARWMTNPIYDAIGITGYIGYCYVYAFLGTGLGTAVGLWLKRHNRSFV